jgi:hypothetical protein
MYLSGYLNALGTLRRSGVVGLRNSLPEFRSFWSFCGFWGGVLLSITVFSGCIVFLGGIGSTFSIKSQLGYL